jgi:hypothetical protein
MDVTLYMKMVVKSEVVAGYDFKDYGCYIIQEDDGFVDVLDEHKNIYMLCCEHLNLVYGASQASSFGPSKTCDKLP